MTSAPPDLRTQFKDQQWQQGQLLYTQITRRWSPEERARSNKIERCRAFVNFSISDEGKSRQLVHIYDTPELCHNAVEGHNRKLDKLRISAAIKSKRAIKPPKETP